MNQKMVTFANNEDPDENAAFQNRSEKEMQHYSKISKKKTNFDLSKYSLIRLHFEFFFSYIFTSNKKTQII